MFKIKIIAVGKYKASGLAEFENEYLKRLSVYAKIHVLELKEAPYSKESDASFARKSEAKKILKLFKTSSTAVALDERGKQYDSVGFAEFIHNIGKQGNETIFVIGSSSGLDESVKKTAQYKLSLGFLTFPHNLARIILLEQLYRAGTILSGKIYHK